MIQLRAINSSVAQSADVSAAGIKAEALYGISNLTIL